MVMYQHSLPRLSWDWMDGFFHRYSYDAENRLTLVETSRDSLVWEKDARYEYYRHGPLARVTLGDQQVQGLDYAYTLQSLPRHSGGWLKGINSTGGSDSADMGEDARATSLNRYTAKDAIGLTLNYFGNDYTAINGMPFPGYSGHMPPGAYRPLYNGNISSSSVYQRKFDYDNSPGLIFYNYKYDQLNRLTGQDAYNGFKVAANNWDSILLMGERLKERITYDANGNIQQYLRNSIDPNQLRMDSLNYRYYAGTNQLRRITDSVQSNEYNDSEGRIVDIDGQPDSNYVYDAIGNLIKDKKENIDSIKWNVYGKIQEITKNDAGAITTIKYTYDALGNRISQTVIPPAGGDKVYTWYVRDAQSLPRNSGGNIMSTYKAVGNDSDLKALDLKQTEKYLYGSSRLGLITSDDGVNDGPDPMQTYRPQLGYDRGNKQYELTNHLGNVLATVSDRKFAVPSDTSSLIDHYEPHIVTAQDYYPFGMLSRVELPSGNKSYKFGFNGKMNDDEVKGGLGNQQDYGMRIYDPRVGRFLSVDPITIEYPELTPYQFASNRPIDGIDRDGLEFEPYWSSTVPGKLASMKATLSQERYNQLDRRGFLIVGGGLAGSFGIGFGTAAYGSFWSWYPSLLYNPVVHTEIIGGLAALGGYNGPDIPSPGQVAATTTIRKWEEWAITTTKGGRELIKKELKASATLIMEKGASFANEGEKRVTQKLLSEGNEVLFKAEVTSTEQAVKSGRNADLYVNCIKAEIKAISGVKNVSNAIKDRLSKASGQAKTVVIDLVDQNGATLEEAENGVIRYFGQSAGNMKEVRVIGKGFDKTIQNKKYKGQ